MKLKLTLKGELPCSQQGNAHDATLMRMESRVRAIAACQA